MNTTTTIEIQQVCIIGAGISGLVSAKTFLEEGYEVVLFEKQRELGGVWEKSRTYPGLTTQNPRDTYAFSDHPMPASYPEWPTAQQVQDYLESYATRFGVAERIQFGAEVTQVKRRTGAHPGWTVCVSFKDDGDGKTREEEHEFDFVLVCNGTFSNPNLPKVSGIDEFLASGGQVLHSTQFNDGSEIEDKRVVVVGFARSASDIATLAAKGAKECTLVFRRAMWKVPRFFFGFVNLKYLLLSRFAEIWFPYRQLRGMERLLHTVGKPLVWAFWRTMETILRLQFRLDACGMLPDTPLDRSVNCNLSMAPVGFYKAVRQGKIQAQKTTIERFVPDGVVLANGECVQADVVIFGTGFHQGLPFLEEKYRRQVIDDRGIFHLYRSLIHPEVPQMGFVGYNSSGFCQLTSEIGARWLVEYAKGCLSLPSVKEILEEMEAEWRWKQTERPYGITSGTCVNPFTFHHINELIQEMGARTRRNPWNPIAEMLMPADPAAYKNLRQELRAKQLKIKN